MRIAVLADIHANLEALEAAAAYLRDHPVDETVVLGDTVGYGADPNACFEWVSAHARVHVMGNHEKAVVDPGVRRWFSDWAHDAITWTERVLDVRFKEEARRLPSVVIREGCVLTHASVHEPEKFHYVLGADDAASSFRQTAERICFIGHTHVPSVFREKGRKVAAIPEGILKLDATDRYILNPGAVGQPRDGDPRLSFGILDTVSHDFQLVRLDYPNEKAAEKIRKAGLPRFLADRLL